MTRFQMELSGKLGQFWQNEAQKELERVKLDLEAGRITVGVDGVARNYLGMKVEEREVLFSEVPDFAECGLCGTAAVISPVGAINDHGRLISFPSGMEKPGPVCQKLYDTLTGIQMGRIAPPDGWIHTVL